MNGERLVADQAVLRPLPEVPFEPCDKRPAKVSSTALVRYRMNDYSVPTAYGFRDVLVKGFVLDQAAPLQSWTLPEPLQHLRRLLEARMGNRGKREFVHCG